MKAAWNYGAGTTNAPDSVSKDPDGVTTTWSNLDTSDDRDTQLKTCCNKCGSDSKCVFWQAGPGKCANVEANPATFSKYITLTIEPTGPSRGQFKFKGGPSPGPSPGSCSSCDDCTAKSGGVCIGKTDDSAQFYEGAWTGDPPKWVICTVGSDGKKEMKTVPMGKSTKVSDTLSALDPSSVDTQTLCADISLSSWSTGQSDPQTATYNGNVLTLNAGYCLDSTTKIPKVVNSNVQHVEVKNLKEGDMIRTTRGDYPLSHIMNTYTIGPHTYVKVEQGALGKNLPSQDLYITHEHSFSLGYYKNSILNRNIHDPAQDDMVYLHITADQLADKLPGITRVQKEFDSMFNLVFDEHVSLDIYGLEVMMHHPKGNPYTLPEEKYQDKTKINNKIQKPLFANYGMLENVKPDHMEMKDFLRNCITANLDNKFRLEDIHHPSFAPQKTMLTEDIREKLRVN